MKKILVSIAAVLLICGAIFTLSSFTSKTETESGSDPYGYVFIRNVFIKAPDGPGHNHIVVTVSLTSEGKAIVNAGKKINFKVYPTNRDVTQYLTETAKYGSFSYDKDFEINFYCENEYVKQCLKQRDFDVEVTGIN